MSRKEIVSFYRRVDNLSSIHFAKFNALVRSYAIRFLYLKLDDNRLFDDDFTPL